MKAAARAILFGVVCLGALQLGCGGADEADERCVALCNLDRDLYASNFQDVRVYVSGPTGVDLDQATLTIRCPALALELTLTCPNEDPDHSVADFVGAAVVSLYCGAQREPSVVAFSANQFPVDGYEVSIEVAAPGRQTYAGAIEMRRYEYEVCGEICEDHWTEVTLQ